MRGTNVLRLRAGAPGTTHLRRRPALQYVAPDPSAVERVSRRPTVR